MRRLADGRSPEEPRYYCAGCGDEIVRHYKVCTDGGRYCPLCPAPPDAHVAAYGYAETDAAYVAMGVITPEEIRQSRFR